MIKHFVFYYHPKCMHSVNSTIVMFALLLPEIVCNLFSQLKVH